MNLPKRYLEDCGFEPNAPQPLQQQ